MYILHFIDNEHKIFNLEQYTFLDHIVNKDFHWKQLKQRLMQYNTGNFVT